MLVELTLLSDTPIAINPISLVTASPSTYSQDGEDKEGTNIRLAGTACDDYDFKVKEDFATVRQRWADALGN